MNTIDKQHWGENSIKDKTDDVRSYENVRLLIKIIHQVEKIEENPPWKKTPLKRTSPTKPNVRWFNTIRFSANSCKSTATTSAKKIDSWKL